jgi:hypothetical protein
MFRQQHRRAMVRWLSDNVGKRLNEHFFARASALVTTPTLATVPIGPFAVRKRVLLATWKQQPELRFEH